MKMKISASVMCANLLNLEKDIKDLQKAKVNYLHFDIMDGSFVPNITLGPDLIKKIREITELKFDTHLMILEPIRYIKEFVEAGSNIIVVHQEACSHLHRTISKIKEYNCLAGVALNPATSIETIEYVLDDVDMVLIMTVNPGFAGQKFIFQMVEKVHRLKNKIDEKGLNIDIEVDGNINDETISKLIPAGANVFVAGTSSVFKKGSDIISNTLHMRETMKKY